MTASLWKKQKQLNYEDRYKIFQAIYNSGFKEFPVFHNIYFNDN